MITPKPLYPTDPKCFVVIFDLSEPDGAASLDRHRIALAGYTSAEALVEGRVALIVRPGWVSRPAA
jgi:hypothetical protein